MVIQLQPHFFRETLQPTPTLNAVHQYLGAPNKRDLAVAEIKQMLQRLAGTLRIVGDHRTDRHTGKLPADHYRGYLSLQEFGKQLTVEVKRICDRDNAFYSPPQQHIHAGLELRTIVLKIGDKRKKPRRPGMILYAAQDLGAIWIRQIENHHA